MQNGFCFTLVPEIRNDNIRDSHRKKNSRENDYKNESIYKKDHNCNEPVNE